jgi:hypothetical protein
VLAKHVKHKPVDEQVAQAAEQGMQEVLELLVGLTELPEHARQLPLFKYWLAEQVWQ